MAESPEVRFGRRLKAAREAAGIRQAYVAEVLGVTRQAVGQWESGKSSPNPDTLARLAEIYGVTVDELVGRAKPLHIIRRGMPLPPPGAEHLSEEELREIEERARAYEEFEIRRRLREKGIDV